MLDFHTHSEHSFDGKATPKQMADNAVSRGLTALAFTEHLERDDTIFGYGDAFCRLQLVPYVESIERLKREYDGRLTIAVGAEAGYTPKCADKLAKELDKVSLDVVLNSAHSALGYDFYDKEYFDLTANRENAYRVYLEAVLKSLDAPYDYDVVAHIGYVCRNATFPAPLFTYDEFPDLLDEILKTIIAKDKSLEINGRAKNAGLFTPDVTILSRYYELGGRRVTYGSDAHFPEQLAMNYDACVDALKKIGFTYLTYYIDRRPLKLLI